MKTRMHVGRCCCDGGGGTPAWFATGLGGWEENSGNPFGDVTFPDDTTGFIGYSSTGNPTHTLIMCLGVAANQGATIALARLVLRGSAGGFPAGDLVLDITAWLDPDPPGTNPGWTLDDDIEALPETVNVPATIAIPTGTGGLDRIIDVTTIVQEIVDQALWENGNRIMFIIHVDQVNSDETAFLLASAPADPTSATHLEVTI